MSVKEYSDPEIGTVKLVKSPVSRRVSIRVHPADGIKVIIPRSLSYDEGLRFFMLKRDWVIAVIAKQKKKISAAEEEGKTMALLRDGAVVNTLLSEIIFRRGEEDRGKAATVTAETVQVEDVKMTGRTFLSPDMPVVRKTLTYTGKLPPEGSHELDIFLRQVLVEVLRTEAKLILPNRLAFFASRFGFSYGKVMIKHNSSNWGSCSSRGNINLNLNLVRLPEPLCDYVILHELCHLRYPDHGPAFHSLLEKLCTDNIVRLAGSGDRSVTELVRKINSSRAALPVHRTLERAMKGYRPV